MQREMERTGRERIKFWPLAFEATGGWGKDMELFFKLCTNAPVTRTRGKADGALALERDGFWGALEAADGRDHWPRAR